jgi:hypothetical protein
VRDSNSQACHGAAVFGTAGLPVSLTLLVKLAGAPGFEPGVLVLETSVLEPLTPRSLESCPVKDSNLRSPKGQLIYSQSQLPLCQPDSLWYSEKR